MVQTRSQLESLSKEELTEDLITVDDITSKSCHHYKKLQQITN